MFAAETGCGEFEKNNFTKSGFVVDIQISICIIESFASRFTGTAKVNRS